MHKIWVKQASREFDPPYQRAPTNNTQTKAKMMLSSIRTSRLSSIRRNHTVPFNGACASCSTHLTPTYDAAPTIPLPSPTVLDVVIHGFESKADIKSPLSGSLLTMHHNHAIEFNDAGASCTTHPTPTYDDAPTSPLPSLTFIDAVKLTALQIASCQ